MPKTTLRQPNCRSSLAARRRTQDPMAAYDRLPPELRGWLAQAALPWSARSALRAWQRALQRFSGDTDAAKQHLSRCERSTLTRDRLHMPEPLPHAQVSAPSDPLNWPLARAALPELTE
jgi:hypothetical protein